MVLPELFSADPTLIRAKLIPPGSPTHVIRRPRLLETLDIAARRRVVTVVAPAGFGKTVLVSDWLSTQPHRPVAWVSLDSSDDAPSRFWTYVLTALSRVGLDVPQARTAVATVGSEPPEQTLGQLANSLLELDEHVFLVLDDYHLITDPTIHRDLAFLIDQQLPHLRLVVLSRTDPPLGLSRGRAHGHVSEVRATDLAFNRQEATTYLIEQGVPLTPEIWESLYERVGGWAAVLHLVALWATNHADQAGAITRFGTGDTAIADYVTTEVLGSLPDKVRRFLLQTSVLTRLNGPLCDAVTGDKDGAATLRELFRRGLFLESLDAEHEWFRYHQLFGELLRNESRRSQPELMGVLHRRASEWCESQGVAADAIDHSIQAKDWPNVQRLMLGEVLSIGARYQPAVIESWLKLIPAPVMRAGPFFQLMHAFALGHIGEVEEAQRAIDRAAELVREAEPGTLPPHVATLITVVAGGIARLNCDLEAMNACSREVEDAARRPGAGALDITEMALAAAGNSLSATLFFHGDIGAAEFHAVAVERRTDNQHLVRMHASALSTRAVILATSGRLRQSEKVADRAMETAAGLGISELFQVTGAHLARAIVAVQRGQDDEAGELLAEVTRRAERHADRGAQFVSAVRRAEHAGRAGDHTGGIAILQDLRSRWLTWKPPTSLLAEAGAAEIRLCIQAGELSAASAVMALVADLDEAYVAVTITKQLAAGRVLRAERHHPEALASFKATADLAWSAGQISAVIEAQIQAAMVQHLMNDDDAPSTLHEALLTAQDEGIAAPFLEDPRVLRPLLLVLEAGDQEFSTRSFRRALLDRLGVPSRSLSGRRARSVRPDDLTERELTVLRLLCGSLTGTEIAESLGISTNTLKTHTRRIYAKLGVGNRRDAVRHASNGFHE